MINQKTCQCYELIGLPGSGKSTITEKISNIHKHSLERYTFNRPKPGIINILRFALINISGTLPGIRLYLQMPPDLRDYQALIDYILLGIRFKGFSNRLNGNMPLILDQGAVQQIIALIQRTPNFRSGDLKKILKEFINLNVIYVYIDVPVDVAVHRVMNRKNGQSLADTLSCANARKHLSEKKEITDWVIEELVSMGGTVRKISNENEIDSFDFDRLISSETAKSSVDA